MSADFLNGKKVVYRGAALLPGTPREALAAIAALLVCCLALLGAVSRLPYSAAAEVLIIAVTAIALNRILKRGTFGVTYALTDDGYLVYITKYGQLERETAIIKLSEAEIGEGSLTYAGRRYKFYPDGELSDMLQNMK